MDKFEIYAKIVVRGLLKEEDAKEVLSAEEDTLDVWRYLLGKTKASVLEYPLCGGKLGAMAERSIAEMNSRRVKSIMIPRVNSIAPVLNGSGDSVVRMLESALMEPAPPVKSDGLV